MRLRRVIRTAKAAPDAFYRCACGKILANVSLVVMDMRPAKDKCVIVGFCKWHGDVDATDCNDLHADDFIGREQFKPLQRYGVSA